MRTEQEILKTIIDKMGYYKFQKMKRALIRAILNKNVIVCDRDLYPYIIPTTRAISKDFDMDISMIVIISWENIGRNKYSRVMLYNVDEDKAWERDHTTIELEEILSENDYSTIRGTKQYPALVITTDGVRAHDQTLQNTDLFIRKSVCMINPFVSMENKEPAELMSAIHHAVRSNIVIVIPNSMGSLLEYIQRLEDKFEKYAWVIRYRPHFILTYGTDRIYATSIDDSSIENFIRDGLKGTESLLTDEEIPAILISDAYIADLPEFKETSFHFINRFDYKEAQKCIDMLSASANVNPPNTEEPVQDIWEQYKSTAKTVDKNMLEKMKKKQNPKNDEELRIKLMEQIDLNARYFSTISSLREEILKRDDMISELTNNVEKVRKKKEEIEDKYYALKKQYDEIRNVNTHLVSILHSTNNVLEKSGIDKEEIDKLIRMNSFMEEIINSENKED